jgi:DNA-binding NtrC family response regulator
MEVLQSYDWPGNVRELENVVRRALVLSKGEAILVSDLPREITHTDTIPRTSGGIVNLPAVWQDRCLGTVTPTPDRTQDITVIAQRLFQWAKGEPRSAILPTVHREIVAQALFETEGNQVQAAKLLGISRPTLRNRIKKFNLRGTTLPADPVCVAQ